MIFNSITFLVFFLVFFQLYWWINNRFQVNIRNAFTILASYLFYGWWDWRFLILIFCSTLIDYLIGSGIEKSINQNKRKAFLAVSILANLGLLGFFKYFNFFIESFQDFTFLIGLPTSLTTLNIILPVGISFYTFQTLSYTIDIYNRKTKATSNVLSYFAFVAFFPQLVAGPIARASQFLTQFHDKKIFDYSTCSGGLKLVIWGLFKKVVIADNFGILADAAFNSDGNVSGLVTLVGAFAFAFQVYGDFSGYSDMAIGLAKMLGMHLNRNFRTPYFSSSFSELWSRWHISLTTWFRDYLYYPLGGNKMGKYRTYANILLVFMISGLWHGASITFLIWGILHGLVLVIEKITNLRMNRYIGMPVVFVTFTFLNIPFRAVDGMHTITLISSLFKFDEYSFEPVYLIIQSFSLVKLIILFIVLGLFNMAESKLTFIDFDEWILTRHKYVRMVIYYTIIVAFFILGNFDAKPSFIYFQF